MVGKEKAANVPNLIAKRNTAIAIIEVLNVGKIVAVKTVKMDKRPCKRIECRDIACLLLTNTNI